MSREEIKQILMDLELHVSPQHNKEFDIEVIESMVENVLDGRLLIQFTGMGPVHYKLTDEGKTHVENMGK